MCGEVCGEMCVVLSWGAVVCCGIVMCRDVW